VLDPSTSEAALERWRKDPVAFCVEVLGIADHIVEKGLGLEEYQKDILYELAADPYAHICVKSCHGAESDHDGSDLASG